MLTLYWGKGRASGLNCHWDDFFLVYCNFSLLCHVKRTEQCLMIKKERIDKMKQILLSMCALVLLAACSTSGLKVSYLNDDDIVSQHRSLGGFEKVEVNGSPIVYYTQADSFSVCVKGPQDLVDNIITEVDGSKLVVRNKGKLGVVNVTFGDNRKLAVFVTSPDLVGVNLNGSGDFICDRHVDTDVMNIRLRGSGDVLFTDLLCDRCDMELIGSGDLNMKHLDTREASAVLVGSGDIDIVEMNAANTRLSLRGSGDIDVEFKSGCGSVEAELNGSGDITMKGYVQQMSREKHGSGDINSGNLKVGQ